MKEISTLKNLMVFQIQSLFDAENTWSEALKQNAGSITNPQLKRIFEKGSKTASGHAYKLKNILAGFGYSGLVRKNIVSSDLAREISEVRGTAADPEVLDAGIIVAHQCMNHYMIAKYGTVASFARLLLDEKLAQTLHDIMVEEKREDEELSELAEKTIKIKAKTALIH
jgi:ferritin-like metal-binding protein YciE